MAVIDTSLVQRAADALWEADRSRSAIAPVREMLGTSTDIDVGYAVQQINTDRSVAAGRKISGRKIGVTS
ncbi:MAG: 2-keto-4-pentenoate hydratase, partial [Ilumatobacteraceae bacterium]